MKTPLSEFLREQILLLSPDPFSKAFNGETIKESPRVRETKKSWVALRKIIFGKVGGTLYAKRVPAGKEKKFSPIPPFKKLKKHF